eukprot:COSAG02_NODE_35225_length_471_cov_8.043011_1_plen_135_part_10
MCINAQMHNKWQRKKMKIRTRFFQLRFVVRGRNSRAVARARLSTVFGSVAGNRPESPAGIYIFEYILRFGRGAESSTAVDRFIPNPIVVRIWHLMVLRTFGGVDFSLILSARNLSLSFFGTDCAQVFNFLSCPNM